MRSFQLSSTIEENSGLSDDAFAGTRAIFICPGLCILGPAMKTKREQIWQKIWPAAGRMCLILALLFSLCWGAPYSLAAYADITQGPHITGPGDSGDHGRPGSNAVFCATHIGCSTVTLSDAAGDVAKTAILSFSNAVLAEPVGSKNSNLVWSKNSAALSGGPFPDSHQGQIDETDQM